MKKLVIICMVALAFLSAPAANPGTRHETALFLSAQAEEYYTGDYAIEALSVLSGSAALDSSAAWSSPLCAALRTRMNETRTYLPTYAGTLSCFPATDAGGSSEGPLRFYSDDFGTYNRERVWADSRGRFYHDGAGRDLHHLRPSAREDNLVRSSMTFGNVRGQFDEWETWPETGEPVFWYREDWNQDAGLLEVRDEVKGDVARILLYVYVTYGDEEGGTCNLWTDLPEIGEGTEYSDGLRVIESLDTLLEWMALDPVDTWELGRNDVVQGIQGNRNVFIDYPELAFLLFDREIPDMPTPSGLAHSLHCTVTAVADPEEGGSLTVSGSVVTAVPAPGWAAEDWTLEPADAATAVRDGNVFTLTDLRESCTLTVHFIQYDPCPFGHSWNDGALTVRPGCETAGERTFACTVCGTEKIEPVPALGHDWHTENLTPNCVRPGIYLESCWRCGMEIETPTEPPLGHAWDEGTVTREPTKTEPGERTYRCTRCGTTRTEEIPFRFLDVSDESAYYFQPVYWALYHEPPITSGTGPCTFSPNDPCTRAQVVSFLWRALGRPEPQGTSLPFRDVSANAYYYKAVLWALENNVTSGTSPEAFSPNAVCTRAQVATFLWKSVGSPEPEDPAPPFADVPQGAYYRKAVAWAAEQGLVAGTGGGFFSPKKTCTRAQVVTMLWKLYQ